MERVAGIEPASSAWKAEVLPLNYTRGVGPRDLTPQRCSDQRTGLHIPNPKVQRLTPPSVVNMVEGGGFEPPKLSRQIYSLIPLATREPLQEGAHSLDVNRLCQPICSVNFLPSEAWQGPVTPVDVGMGAR